LLLSFSLQTLGDKEEGAATVRGDQRVVGVLEKAGWWFGVVSKVFELIG
jgi:hypothetical protein